MVTPSPLYLTPVQIGIDPLAVCYAKIQSQITQAVNTAGISYTMNNLLRNIQVGNDTETVCLAIIQNWLTVLAQGISGGGGWSPSTVVATAVSGTLAANSYTVVTAAGNTTQTLPTSPVKGTVCEVKNQGAGTVTVASGSANIFGASAASSYVVGGQGALATFTFDGTYWNVS